MLFVEVSASVLLLHVDYTDVPAADCVDAADEAIIAADVNPMPHVDGVATMPLAMNTYIHISIHMEYTNYCCHCCLHAATADDAAGVLLPPLL